MRCRGGVLVLTHLLCAVAVYLACYRWQNLLPNRNIDNSAWASKPPTNGTASHDDTASTTKSNPSASTTKRASSAGKEDAADQEEVTSSASTTPSGNHGSPSATASSAAAKKSASSQNAPEKESSPSTASTESSSGTHAIESTETIHTSSFDSSNPATPPKSGKLDFTAPPLIPKGTVKNIYWMHVPKAGGSFFNTIFFEFCPRALPKEREAAAPLGRTINKGHLTDMWLIEHYPPEQWCGGVSFYNMPIPGFHHPFAEHPGEVFFSMTMFRDPIERLWSAYGFGRHGSLVEDPSETKFADYVREPNIPNCQLKMVLGYHCHEQQAKELDVDLAIARVTNKQFFFGITERWEESICLFHRWFGGVAMPDVEMINSRKGLTAAPGNYHNEVPMHDEMKWYQAILPVFEERLKAANCLGYEPRFEDEEEDGQ